MKPITRFCQLLPVALLLLTGCGDSGRDKAIVSGNVSYHGEPVRDGRIRFVPIEGTKGPASGAVIQDGSYAAKAIGGVPLGKLRVEIKAYRKPASESPREGRNGPDLAFKAEAFVQYLPPKYNHQSELTITLETGGEQTRDFELP